MDALEIQEELDAVRLRLLETLAALPDEALTEAGAVGEWTIADVLAHFVNWEAELVTGLNHVDQGKKPVNLLQALEDRQAYNASRYEQLKGRKLDRVFDDLHGVRIQLEDWLEEFSQADLEKPDRFPWLEEKALWQIIGETSFEHEKSHLPEIGAFAERWLQTHDTSESMDVIEVVENGNRS